MTRNNKFQRGHGVFNCLICNRKTRGDGDSASLDMCGQCYELSGWDNHHNDNGTKPDADEAVFYNNLLSQIESKGGDVERVRRLNDYIFVD